MDETGKNIRVSWAINCSVQLIAAGLHKEEEMDALVDRFIAYLEEKKAKVWPPMPVKQAGNATQSTQADMQASMLDQLAADEAREHPRASQGVNLGTNKGGSIRIYKKITN